MAAGRCLDARIHGVLMKQRRYSSLESWLLSVDSTGSLRKFLAFLQDNFDHAEQIVDAYVAYDGRVGKRILDERFFEDIGVEDPDDQRKFEAWFTREAGIEPRKPQLSTASCGVTNLEDWLRRVDSTGSLWSASRQAVQEHFDCAEQVIEAYTEVLEPTGQVLLDPQIFSDFGLSTQSQRLALSSWFSAASADGMDALVRACRGEICIKVPVACAASVSAASPELAVGSTRAGGQAESAMRINEVTTSPSVDMPTKPAKPTRVGMTPREEALRPWCALAGVPEEVLIRLRAEDVWHPEDLLHLEKPDLADIVKGMKKGVQGRFFSAVHSMRKAKGLVPPTPRVPESPAPELNGH